MNSTKTAVHQKTPTVSVLNNRGHVIRDIAYHRHPDSPDKTDERITRHQYDARGFLQQSADPRLSDAKRTNFRYLTSLSGQVLRTESCDAGTSLALSDVAGRPVIAISQISTDQNGEDDLKRAVTHTFQYESGSAGRPLSITEQLADNALITERFIYGNSSQAAKDKNLAGVCTHHYDPAGLTQTESLALTGVPLSVTRQLLKEADNPDLSVNWPENNPDALLSAEKYTTQTIADATGEVLITTDSAGHQQKVTYDVAGLLRTSRIILKNGTEKTIIKSVNYSAAGQKLREEHGNGVVTTYTYEAQTQRLIAIKTEHPAKKNVLQDLRYEYDPVGNVLCVTNNAEETRFWHNQKVVPENRYVYDSLYQLVSATGREMANAGQQSSSLPDSSTFDKATYTNYTRHYSYDSAGNMTHISHSAPATRHSYTTEITVSNSSNHAVLKELTDIPDKVDALFTPGGQQTQLMSGQTLTWTPRGELHKVTLVTREGEAGDSEHYRYGADSQRILKVSVQKTGNSTQTQRVVYLPGLELRTGAESYQVICAGASGRAQVRYLHWADGSKKDQLRFSYDNLTGSSGLETDGDGNRLSQEEYYPFGGTAVLVARPDAGIDYKTHRYSGKERDATGLYYYGYRYYQPWAGRWLSSDPAGTVDGLNLYQMVSNNPVRYRDNNGLVRFDTNDIDTNLINGVIPFLDKSLVKFDPSKNKYTKYKETYVTELLESHKHGMVSFDEAKSTLKNYAETYHQLNKKYSLDDKNMKLGASISMRIMEGIISYEHNLINPVDSGGEGHSSDHDDSGYNNREIKYFALKDKNKKNIYAMGAVVVLSNFMHNRVAVSIENIVSNPLTQLRKKGISFYEQNNIDPDFLIKGAGNRLVAKILKGLSQTHIIERISTDTVNPRSAAIAKKMSNIATSGDISSRLKRGFLTSVGKVRNLMPKTTLH